RHTRFSRDWSSDVCSSDLRFMPEGYPVDAIASSRRAPMARLRARPWEVGGAAVVELPPGAGDATLVVSAWRSRAAGPTGVRGRAGSSARRRGGGPRRAAADADPGQVGAAHGLLKLQHHAPTVVAPDLLQRLPLAAARQDPMAAPRQLQVEEGGRGPGRAGPDVAARVVAAGERPCLRRHGDCIEQDRRGPAVDHLHADGKRTVAGEGDAGESANEEE